ncbi:transcriptional regulator [Streptomyces bacillaris]|uniref:transcriptional regulator n=1 Tax=Streptomyces bacillaris TaxID=68179 RepID=UPI003826B1BD
MKFSRVRESLGVSDSVLSKQLKVLAGAGYVEVAKVRGRRTPAPGSPSPVTAGVLWRGTSWNSATSSALPPPPPVVRRAPRAPDRSPPGWLPAESQPGARSPKGLG